MSAELLSERDHPRLLPRLPRRRQEAEAQAETPEKAEAEEGLVMISREYNGISPFLVPDFSPVLQALRELSSREDFADRLAAFMDAEKPLIVIDRLEEVDGGLSITYRLSPHFLS